MSAAAAVELQVVDAAGLVAELLREYLLPPRVMACSDWADAYRRIVKGPERGPWRTARTPYLREPMDCTDPQNPVQKVVMQFATQLGKSEVLYNACFKRVHLDPVDMMMVQPTLQDAKDHSRQRFAPTARQMPQVAERMPDNRSRDETNTTLTKEIRGGASLFFAGANSARSLASKPLGVVGCDEIDGYPDDVDGEGDPIALVWERMSNFPARKLILCSTPTLKDFSRIESEYLASDRRRYWLPCPHCGEFQVLQWGADAEHGLKWLRSATGQARPETAVYICRHCAAAIEERHKTAMLAAGGWRADAPGAQRGLVAGFHLSKLYSPLGWKSWAMLVEDWEAAQAAARIGDLAKLKTFVNTSLAETWEERGDHIAGHELQRRAQDTPLRQLLPGMLVCTAGVDVQGDRVEAYIWAWGRGMERQLVDRAILYGNPGLAEGEAGSPWTALTEYLGTPILHPDSGKRSPILAAFVDSGGHHTQAVYAYCRAHQARHVHPVKGASTAGKAVLGKPTDQDVSWLGTKIRRGVKLWPIGTDTAKAELHSRLRTQQPGPGYVHMSSRLPADVFEQLTAERLVTRYVKGRPRLEWVKPAGRRNEALDCAVYALAAAHYVGIDRWGDGDWARWQVRVADPDPAPAPSKPRPGRAGAPATAPDQQRQQQPPAVQQQAAATPQPAPAPRAPIPPRQRPGGRQW